MEIIQNRPFRKNWQPTLVLSNECKFINSKQRAIERLSAADR